MGDTPVTASWLTLCLDRQASHQFHPMMQAPGLANQIFFLHHHGSGFFVIVLEEAAALLAQQFCIARNG
jgi:hypothetical protein